MSLALLGDALLLAFVTCCLGSAILQVLAWTRHASREVPVSLRALWKPEGHFDEGGLRLIRLARRLLLVGGLAYLGYGALLIVMTASG